MSEKCKNIKAYECGDETGFEECGGDLIETDEPLVLPVVIDEFGELKSFAHRKKYLCVECGNLSVDVAGYNPTIEE